MIREMKKILALLLGIVLLGSLAGCGNTKNESGNVNTDSVTAGKNAIQSGQGTEQTADGKVLVVYFSQPETDKAEGMTEDEDNSVVVVDGEVMGNIQYMASVIQQNTGADIFRIEPETPYPTDHDKLVDLASEEQKKDARPKIKAGIDGFEQYSTVFVGYDGVIIGLN